MNDLTHNSFSAKRLLNDNYEIFDGASNTGLYTFHTENGWALINSCDNTIAVKGTIKDCLKLVEANKQKD